MRFILALVSLVIAIGLAGSGVAQRTFLNGPDHITASTGKVESPATATVISGTALNAFDGRQDLSISGSETVFAAYGRTSDIIAWIGDTRYNQVEMSKDATALRTTVVDGTETEVPSPAGSDLWLREYTAPGALDIKMSLSDDLSLLIVSDGIAPAPGEISITWPLDNRTPWAGPLMAAGGLMFLVAVAFAAWGYLVNRRSRGPRRRQLTTGRQSRMPRRPRQRAYRAPKPKVITSNKGRRSSRRMIAVVPVMLVSSLALGGCSSALWPDANTFVAAPSASPSPSAPASEEGVLPPGATTAQLSSVVRQVIEVQTEADTTLGADLIATRFAGPALDLRLANYAIRGKDAAAQGVPGVPLGDVKAILPEATESWPRVALVVVFGPETETSVAPMALMLVQDTPREQYKVTYAISLLADAMLPELAPETVGAPRLLPDTKLLSFAPSDLPAAYSDVVNTGDQSASFGLFDIEKDTLLKSVAEDGKVTGIGVEARAARKAALPANLTIDLSNAPAESDLIALASNESGALVTTYLTDTEQVKPVGAGASVSPEGATKTLSGITNTTKGVSAVFGDQLLFYIPPIGSPAKIVLLGFSTGLISAKEIP